MKSKSLFWSVFLIFCTSIPVMPSKIFATQEGNLLLKLKHVLMLCTVAHRHGYSILFPFKPFEEKTSRSSCKWRCLIICI